MTFVFSPVFLAAIVYLPIAWWFVARATLRWMGPVGRGIRHHGAVCGNCGHPAIHRDSEMCPECGVRYSIAGVATPITAYNAAPSLLCVGIALSPLIIVIGVLSAQAIGAAIMYTRHGVVSVDDMSYRISARPFASPPPSGGPGFASFSLGFEVKALTEATYQRPLQGLVTVSLSGTGVSTHHLEYEIHTDQWTIRNQSMVAVEQSDGVDRGVEALLIHAGLNPDVEPTALTLSDTQRWVRALASTGELPSPLHPPNPWQPEPGKLSQQRGGSRSTFPHSFAGGTIASVSGFMVGALLLAGSLVLIFMERRRLVKRCIDQSDQ